MAVSMSAGGSGYMRSDFMISDAAIPLRVEESMEQADNSGQFSKVLNGIGEAKKAAEPTVPTEVSSVPNDPVKLVEAVVNGEVKLEDIPEVLLTQEMLKELTKLVESADIPEVKEEIADFSKDPAAQELLAVMFSAQQAAVTPDDRTEELSALTAQPEVEAVQPAEPQQAKQAIPVQAETPVTPQETEQTQEIELFAKQIIEAAPEAVSTVPQEKTEIIEEAVKFAKNVDTETESVPASDKETFPAAVKQPEEQTVEVVAVGRYPENSGENTEQQSENSDGSGQNSGFTAQAEAAPKQTEIQPKELVGSRSDISKVEVRSAQKTTETEQTEQIEQSAKDLFPQDHAQRSRVVSKSDELEMIRNSADAKPVDENAAQNMVQPQTVPAEKPVVFTRTDGEEIPVKPSEVAQQVADRLVERTEGLKDGDTEYSVTLNPEELGRITVRMTKTADGAVSVSIAAENSRTLKIIEDNGSAIQDSLKQNGVQLESWQTVGESKQEAHAEDYQGSSKNSYRESENERQEQEPEGESFAEIIASM